MADFAATRSSFALTPRSADGNARASRSRRRKRQKTASKDAAGAPSAEAAAGVLVIAVQPGSPAEKAGVARGDIILEANGKAVNDARDLRQASSGTPQATPFPSSFATGTPRRASAITIGTQEGRPWVGILPLPGRGTDAFAFGGGPQA